MEPHKRFPIDRDEESTISWTGALLLTLIIILCIVPSALVADWTKPINLLNSLTKWILPY